MGYLRDHNYNFAIRDTLVMIKLGVNVDVAIHKAKIYHSVKLKKLTKRVEGILRSTKAFYETYDLKSVDFSTGSEPPPNWFFEAVEKEGCAGDVRVNHITNIVKERYNIT